MDHVGFAEVVSEKSADDDTSAATVSTDTPNVMQTMMYLEDVDEKKLLKKKWKNSHD